MRVELVADERETIDIEDARFAQREIHGRTEMITVECCSGAEYAFLYMHMYMCVCV